MRRIGQLLYVVPVELNGSRMAQLILDTGASHTVLSQEIVRELALLPSDYRPGLVILNTASGSVNAQVVRIDSMKIATAEVLNSSAAVHTMPDFPAGVDGLLGLSFLHQFEVTLDSDKGELRLKRVRKLPRQGDSIKGELPAVMRTRKLVGGIPSNVSWGRSSWYSRIHSALISRT